MAEPLTKGMRVIMTGSLVSRSWEANGEKRTVNEIQVAEVGLSLCYASAEVARNQRGSASGCARQRSMGDCQSSDEPPF